MRSVAAVIAIAVIVVGGGGFIVFASIVNVFDSRRDRDQG